MSNSIIYNSQVLENDGEPIQIDSNYILEKKLSKLKKAQEKELRNKLNMDEDAMEGEYASTGVDSSVDMSSEGDFKEADASSNSISEEELRKKEEEANEKAQEIVNNAEADAQDIIEKAKSEAEVQASTVKENARKEGYKAGIIQYQNEIEDKKREFDEKVKELEEKFNKDRENMESDLLDVICEVVEKVFYCQFSNKKEILLNLCNRALSDNEDSKEILVKVSKNNIEEFQKKLPEITKDASENTSVQAVTDPLLSDDQCIIETDGGIIDCSLDTEMDNLMRDLKSLIK